MTSQWQNPELSVTSLSLSAKVLLSSNWKIVLLKTLCFSTLDVGWEKKDTVAFYIKALQNVSQTIRSAEHKSFCLPNFPKSPLLEFSSHFWKAMFPLHLGIANLICSDSSVQTSIASKFPSGGKNEYCFSEFH